MNRCPKCNAGPGTPCAYPDFGFRDCPRHAEIIKGGVEWIMGPGGDEGTRMCTCNEYPHRADCGSTSDIRGKE